jgi:hypothetical protein
MYRFTTIFFINGLLFGGFVFYLYWYDYLPLSILRSLVAGLVFGVILGLTVYFASKRLRNTVINFLILSFLTGTLGLIVGNIIVFHARKLPYGCWIPQKTAPERPVRFVGNSDFTFWGGSIYMETEPGNIYSYRCYAESPCEWERVTDLPTLREEHTWRCPPERKTNALPPPLFERVLDTYDLSVCGPDYEQQMKFVLLENGSIMVWFRHHSVYEIIWNGVQTSIISPVISILGTFVLLLRRRNHDWY